MNISIFRSKYFLFQIYTSYIVIVQLIDQNYYHELAQICSSIEKIYVRIGYREIHGIVELVEMKKTN